MTAPALSRPPTEAEVRAEVLRAIDGQEYQDVLDGLRMVASVIRDPGWTALESPDPRTPGEGTGLWCDLRPTEAHRLVELVDAAEERIKQRVADVISDELTAAGVAFAAEYPEAPRGTA